MRKWEIGTAQSGSTRGPNGVMSVCSPALSHRQDSERTISAMVTNADWDLDEDAKLNMWGEETFRQRGVHAHAENGNETVPTTREQEGIWISSGHLLHCV